MPAPSSNERGDRTGTARPVPGSKEYTLLDADRKPHRSSTPGQFGGHRKTKIYGRLNCRAALRAAPLAALPGQGFGHSRRAPSAETSPSGCCHCDLPSSRHQAHNPVRYAG
jgi:hypothetical protein